MSQSLRLNRIHLTFALAQFVLTCSVVNGQPQQVDDETVSLAERLVFRAGPSIVEISFTGRDGKQQGLGTGFVISKDGLIASNLHVLGEARPISVEFDDGRRFDVTKIHASDRAADLAIIKTKADDLIPLPLGDSDAVKQGEPIVTIGNPHGLSRSVVSGVVSGRREIDQQKMLQLAMPVERGNSGGPVLDSDGKVVGIVTMKSAVTRNLGFAVEINQLKPLIEKPNPIVMSRWLTIGALDPEKWTPMFGAKWLQRSGRIVATGEASDPVGRRSICVFEEQRHELPFEFAVRVRLDDESGAAGLIFHCDGDQKHYGFYPSNGQLRLSRFEGPTVFQWHVLDEVESPVYRRSDWNHLKVRIEPDRILCYVNDQLTITSTDQQLPLGKLGLAKFRDTTAEFKDFQVAKQIAPSQLSAEVTSKLNAMIDELPNLASIREQQIQPFLEHPNASTEILRERAKDLQDRIQRLQQLANDVQTRAVVRQLGEVMQNDQQADLLRAALLIAKLDDEDLNVDAYLQQVDRMASEIQKTIHDDFTDRQSLDALNRYLFVENGFHGGRTNYYHRANSHLSRVLEDREGLPITLSVLYIELARRIGLTIEGVGLPGHFVVRHVPADDEPQLIDVFDAGRSLTRSDARRIVKQHANLELDEQHLLPVTKKDIVIRMLNNLLGTAQEQQDVEATLRYLEAMLAVDESLNQARLMRAFARFNSGRQDDAITDLDWLIDRQPEEMDLQKLQEARAYFEQRRKK